MIMGDGKNCDDFVYVDNVVHGHLCAEKTLSTREGARRSGGKVRIYHMIHVFSVLTCSAFFERGTCLII
jgi:nucleoside-diphosphate-sugar epimerase